MQAIEQVQPGPGVTGSPDAQSPAHSGRLAPALLGRLLAIAVAAGFFSLAAAAANFILESHLTAAAAPAIGEVAPR
ncbi:MAG: hypothetical protein JWP36_402 [Paucimonas sp.]|nr:hypothetical protein [Paucimonas sp.]